MRVLMLAPEPFFDFRGTPISIYYRSRTLVKLDHEIDIIAYHLGKEINLKNVRIFRVAKIPLFKSVPIGPSLIKILLDVILFFKSLQMLIKNEYDCIHAHEEAVFIACILKMVFRIPVIYDMHSRIPEQLVNFNFFKNRVAIKLASIIEKWVIDNSDIVLTICKFLESTVKRINPEKRVVNIENVLPLFHEHAISKKTILKIRKSLGIRNEKIVMYTGTFAPYQGLDLLFESIPYVIKKFTKVKFVLVGGELENIAKMSSLSKSLGISDYIVFAGKQPLEEIPSFYALADIFVSPREVGTNVPLKIYSYLRAGKPIVATKHISHTQVLNERVAILTSPKPESLGEGIVRVLEENELGKRLGTEGRKFLEKRFSYDYFLLKTKQAYEYVEKQSKG